MHLTAEQLEGLDLVLPAGYPRSCGVIVVRGKKSRARKVRRKATKPLPFVPWYQRAVTW